jgi:chromosome partitioning protein
MKKLALANQKGGVGKSTVDTQLAYYYHLILNKRVIVIDLDHQGNTSKAIRNSGLAVVSKITASQILKFKVNINDLEDAPFLLIPADDELRNLEKKESEHNNYVNNLYSFMQAIDKKFDVGIFDTNPNPDIRQLSALIVSDFVLSPVQLNQEAIDGIGDLLNHERTGIRKIKATINKNLEFIGILPNIVEPTPFQKDNFKDLAKAYAKLLIPLKGGGFAAIKKSTAIAEAQAAAKPVWKLGKTSARTSWLEMKPVFEKIASVMGVQ